MLKNELFKLVWDQEQNEQLRLLGFTIIGQIVKRVSGITAKNLIELQAFFKNLSCDNTDIRGAARDCMLTMIDAFKDFMKEEQSESKTSGQLFMLALLSEQIEAKEPMARFVAVKYTAAAFDPDHVASRYLLMLSSGDRYELNNDLHNNIFLYFFLKVFLCFSNSDVSSVALQSLYSSVEEEDINEKKIIFPDFQEMTQFVFEKAMGRLKNVNLKFTIQNHDSPFNDTTFTEVLRFF